jgi:ABC-type glycerol-3-phosphate transport system permease component
MENSVEFIGIMLAVAVVMVVVVLIVFVSKQRKKAWLQDGNRRD